MKMLRRRQRFLAAALALLLGVLTGGISLFASCGPFTDFTDAVFCQFVLEIFYLGITTGTTPTTYEPASPVSRLQMAAFLSRTVDAALRRGSRRASMGHFFSPTTTGALAITTVGNSPQLLRSDGADVWVPNMNSNSVSRVRASDGRLLETWTGATKASGPLVALGRVIVTGFTSPGTPGNLFTIDPTQPAGSVATVASNLGSGPSGIAFDGSRVWTANVFEGVSIVTPGVSIPWTVTTVTAGFSQPKGALYDGTNIWVTDQNASRLLKLNSAGGILQTVTVGATPLSPAFDGANIWVPSQVGQSVTVVRASTGAVLGTLTGNGLAGPQSAAFDGERVLVACLGGLSLWKAADLTSLGSLPTFVNFYGSCSDGVDFWVSMNLTNQIARF